MISNVRVVYYKLMSTMCSGTSVLHSQQIKEGRCRSCSGRANYTSDHRNGVAFFRLSWYFYYFRKCQRCRFVPGFAGDCSRHQRDGRLCSTSSVEQRRRQSRTAVNLVQLGRAYRHAGQHFARLRSTMWHVGRRQCRTVIQHIVRYVGNI